MHHSKIASSQSLHSDLASHDKPCLSPPPAWHARDQPLPGHVDFEGGGRVLMAFADRVYEIYLQLHGRAGQRQLPGIDRGLTHKLGGHPHQNVCAVSIVGRHGA